MKEIRSFQAAFHGLWLLWTRERHGRFHLAASIIALTGGWYFHLETFEWIAVLMCIGLVNGLEALNSSLEQTLDHLHPENDPSVSRAKDVAAGGVLIASITSAIIGLVVFGPHILEATGL